MLMAQADDRQANSNAVATALLARNDSRIAPASPDRAVRDAQIVNRSPGVASAADSHTVVPRSAAAPAPKSPDGKATTLTDGVKQIKVPRQNPSSVAEKPKKRGDPPADRPSPSIDIANLTPAPDSTSSRVPDPTRTWNIVAARAKIIARFVSYQRLMVTLMTSDGKLHEVPFIALSEADKDYVRRVTQLDIPNLLLGTVSGVVSPIVIKVKNEYGDTEDVRLLEVEHTGNEGRKALVDLAYKKDVVVLWYDRDVNKRIEGIVFQGDILLNIHPSLVVLTKEAKSRAKARAEALAAARSIAVRDSVARRAAPSGKIWVEGYYRKDGTYVRGHYRTRSK